MISNAKDRVSVSALLRSVPVPRNWVVTFGWDRAYIWNQENGWMTGAEPLPSWSDIGKVTGWRIFSWPG